MHARLSRLGSVGCEEVRQTLMSWRLTEADASGTEMSADGKRAMHPHQSLAMYRERQALFYYVVTSTHKISVDAPISVARPHLARPDLFGLECMGC